MRRMRGAWEVGKWARKSDREVNVRRRSGRGFVKVSKAKNNMHGRCKEVGSERSCKLRLHPLDLSQDAVQSREVILTVIWYLRTNHQSNEGSHGLFVHAESLSNSPHASLYHLDFETPSLYRWNTFTDFTLLDDLSEYQAQTPDMLLICNKISLEEHGARIFAGKLTVLRRLLHSATYRPL